MKALTICQPYAEMIRLGLKRVENRAWPTRHRGLIYIHAGKSRSWLHKGYGDVQSDEEQYPGMAFGAVVAIARLVDCVQLTAESFKKYPWLETDPHAGGLWCWILESVNPIGPWPYRGAQGLFNIPDGALEAVANRELEIEVPE